MLEQLRRHVIADPFPFAIDLARCHGSWLVTVDGQDIFDWAGYYGSKLIGHNHPRLAEPDYVRRLLVAANNKIANPDFLTAECLEYYQVLYDHAPRCMRNEQLELYVVNSGAEAVENMMKYLMVLHQQKQQASGHSVERQRFIYFDQAFHGRTVFALNITMMQHAPVATEGFHGLMEGNLAVPFPAHHTERSDDWNADRQRASLASIEAALQRYGPEIAGIIVEPIQGAGGHRVAPKGFFQQLSELAHRHDVGLGFDEVQTAGGQTGSFFAIDQFDLPHPPQAVASGKKLGNGVIYMLHPMEKQGVLDSTWGGTLADMVRVVQELAIVRDERLIEQVPALTQRLLAGLSALDQRHGDRMFNVRGMGLYQGFSLRSPLLRDRLLSMALQDEQLLLLGSGYQSVRLRPSLSITDDDIDRLIERLDRCLTRLGAEGLQEGP